jgi:hypothetical protein
MRKLEEERERKSRLWGSGNNSIGGGDEMEVPNLYRQEERRI